VFSSLSEGFLQSFFGISLSANCLSNLRGDFLLSLCNSLCVISIRLSNQLCCIGLGILNNLVLDELSLSYYLIKLKISVGIDLVNQSFNSSSPFTLNPRLLGFNLLNFFLLLHLRKETFLVLILAFFFLDLSFFMLLFLIVENSLIKCKLLSLKSVLELEDSFLLKSICHWLMQNNVRDNSSFDQDTLVF